MPDPHIGPDVTEDGHVRMRLEEILGTGSPRESLLVARLVRGYAAKAAGLLDEALAAAAAGDAETAALRLHSLRGTSANLGSVGLPPVCARVEASAAAGDCAAVVSHGPLLRRGVEELSLVLAGAASGLLPPSRDGHEHEVVARGGPR